GLTDWARRSAFFLRALDRFDEIRRGDPEYFAKAFMQTMKTDRVAARLLLGSVQDIALEDLAQVTMPTLVVCGSEDADNGSAPALARRLADATYVEVPGTHMSSVTQRQLGEAIASFLSA
ncbi:MAG TPA: alpha/beta hydrolase, partial [Novosphingobium sp.]|nr:alpha/beta hydrolase [Novosphingobium sp.]